VSRCPPPYRPMCAGLSRPVHIGAVVNPKHGDGAGLVVDLVDYSIGACRADHSPASSRNNG
jgi:hypothetical protein